MSEHTHTTRDLYFAAFLSSSRGKLVTTSREGARLYFTFELPQDFERLRAAWYGGHGEVSAMGYVQALKNLKALTYSL